MDTNNQTNKAVTSGEEEVKMTALYVKAQQIEVAAETFGVTTHEICRALERGDFLKLIAKLVPSIHTCWAHCEFGDCPMQHLSNYKKQVPLAQMFEQITSLPAKIGNTLTNVDSTAFSIKTFTDLLTQYATQIKSYLTLPSLDVVVFSANVCSLLFGLYHKDITTIIFAGVSVSRQLDLPCDFFMKIYEIVTKYFESPQVNNTVIPVAQMNFFQPNWLGGTLMVALTAFAKGSLPTYDVCSKLLSDFGRTAIGFKNLKDLADYLYSYARVLFYKYVCDKDIEQIDQDKLYPNLSHVLQMCELLESPEFKTVYIDRSKELCRSIIDLAVEVEVLLKQARTTRDAPMEKCLAGKASKLDKLVKMARASAVFSRTTKVAPTAIYLYGKAGVGKSVLVEYLKVALYNKYYTKSSWTQSDLSFTRAMDSDYWDGYCGQPILCYDDIFQRKDSPTAPCPDYMDIISIVNESPFHLNMSAVEDKKNCYMECDFVLASSNLHTINPQSIQSPDAVRRRFDIPVEVSVDPKFLASDGIKLDLDKVQAFHQQNGTSGFCPEAYQISRIDLANGNRIGIVQTLNEFVDEIYSVHKEKQERSIDLAQSFNRVLGITASEKLDDFAGFMKSLKLADCTTPAEIDIKVNLLKTADTINGVACNFILEQKERLDKLKVEMYKKVYECQNSENVVDISKFEDALDEYSLYDVVQNKCKETFDEWTKRIQTYFVQAIYFIERGIKRVRTVVNWENAKTTAQIIFAKFGNWAYLDSTVMGIAGVIVGSAVAFGLTKLVKFAFGQCKLLAFRSFEEVKHYSGDCECSQCAGLYVAASVKHRLGSALHALGFLRYVSRHAEDPAIKSKAALLYTCNAKTALQAEFKTYPDGAPLVPTRTLYAENKFYPDGAPLVPSRVLYAEGDKALDADTCLVPRERNGKPVAQQSDKSQLQIQEAITRTNMVRLHNKKGGELNGVFITGRTLLVPYHFWVTVDKTFQVRNPFLQETQEIDASMCRAHRCKNVQGNVVDLCLIEMPLMVASRRNIINYFAPADTFEFVVEGSIIIAGLRNIRDVPVLNTFHATKFSYDKGELVYTDETRDLSVTGSLSYDVDTIPGDCGSIVMVRNTAMLGKIVGIHIAGLNGEGFAACVSREFLMRNLLSVGDTRSLVDSRIPHAEFKKLPHSFGSMTLTGDYVSLGNLPPVPTNGKSSIYPSLISGMVAATTMMPALLKRGGPNDPMVKNISKLTNTQTVLPQAILNIAVADVKQVHATPPALHRVLTYEEALTGITGTGVVALNRASSPGYPYCLNNPGGGKHSWFGKDEWIINEEIRKDVQDLENNCKQNIRTDVVYVATLKDERRPIEKVLAGKTRVFAAAPMHYVILFRRYFAAFIAHVMNNKIENEIGVGTNVYSLDWTKTARKLQKYGDHVIAGDFSNFDGSLHQEILWKILDMTNEWYNDSQENQLIRKVLFEDICNARVLMDGEIINLTHSQPSGNPMTVILNSLFNQIVMRMAYVDLRTKQGLPAECDFRANVSMQTYGDDNCLNISPNVIEWYNQQTITVSLARFGLTYTDETKSNESAKSRSLCDIAYLKRTFECDEVGNFNAPLNFDVIMEMCNWVKGTTAPKTSLALNVETAMVELALYGRDIYNDYSARFASACRAKEVIVNIPAFESVDDWHFHSKYGMSKYA